MPARGTATRNFGSGRRESHDASAFYSRFTPPRLSAETRLSRFAPEAGGGELWVGDSRAMDRLPDSCVALVVTSPPYFAGKAYEEALGAGAVPSDYFEYLGMLRDVFAECVRVLEPGGRLAVNVANLGRRPYRSLAADLIGILQDDLGLLLRGEIVWAKAEGASGSCAWGSFRSAANPVLRDLTERVIVASKGRFDRALSPAQRRDQGLAHDNSIGADEFMEATLDLWHLLPESARRVGHPAPFPVELPLRLIELYTYRDDLVLDPFLGSGTTAVAAARSGRRWCGCDTDAGYVELARHRVARELESLPSGSPGHRPGVSGSTDDVASGPATAASLVRSARDVAEELLTAAGFVELRRNPRLGSVGTDLSFSARDGRGRRWLFDLVGSYAQGNGRRGLGGGAVWPALGRAVAASRSGDPVVLLTTALPPHASAADKALRAAGPGVVFDVVELGEPKGAERLVTYATGSAVGPRPGFWSADVPIAGLTPLN